MALARGQRAVGGDQRGHGQRGRTAVQHRFASPHPLIMSQDELRNRSSNQIHLQHQGAALARAHLAAGRLRGGLVTVKTDQEI